MIELKPKDVGALAVIGMLFTFVILLITSREDGGCNIIGVSSLPSCSSSIDLSPTDDLARYKSIKPYPPPIYDDRYHEIDEPSSLYLFGVGGGFLLFRRIRKGSGLS